MTLKNYKHVLKSIVTLLFLIHSIHAQTNSTNSCSPTACSAICNPTCNNGQTCILKTMTECGVCPQAKCVASTVVGSPTATSTSSSSSNDTPVIVGGIVGGLAGLGILVGIIVYCYLKKHRKLNRKLPFAFTSASHVPRSVPQEKNTPHPAVIAALQRDSPPNRHTSYNAGTDRQSVHALNQLNPIVEEEDEFEKRIALQNKRLSEIILSNPRLSYNTEHIGDITTDDDDQKSVSTMESAVLATRASSTPSSVAVVQVVRAKPQIMRVNSVRSTNTGLSRNNSVRTVLTSVTDTHLPSSSRLTVKEEEEEDSALFNFPTTPNNLSFNNSEDPFNDTHSIPNQSLTTLYYNTKS